MTYFRLEAQSVDPELTEGLAARVADPLWYLARQFQVGEFRAEDAATPMILDMDIDAYQLSSIQAGRTEIPIDARTPLEALVEQEAEVARLSYRRRAEAGIDLLRSLSRLSKFDEGDILEFIENLKASSRYQLRLPRNLDKGDTVGAARLRLMAKASFDGKKLFDEIAEVVEKFSKQDVQENPQLLAQIPFFVNTDTSILRATLLWYELQVEALVTLPTRSVTAWNSSRQEYRFRVKAGVEENAQIELSVPEYPGGRLDWHYFDFDKQAENVQPSQRMKKRLLVTPLVFAGQPAQRFWQFEDGEVYFGGLAGGEGDIARSVLAAYAAVAGDDWYVAPAALPSNHIFRINRLRVLDNFSTFAADGTILPDDVKIDDNRLGADLWTEIDSCAELDASKGSRIWKWQEIAGQVEKSTDGRPMLFLPNVLSATREGPVLEEVRFRRDNAANLAWAIEAQYHGAFNRAVIRTPIFDDEPEPPKELDDWQWTLGRSVPSNWIPLVPVRIQGRSEQVILRRGRMSTNDSPPKGLILTSKTPFLLEEHEIPESGIATTRRFQTARTASGALALWIGRKKRPAPGSLPSSTLEFDHLRGFPKRTP